ncbi:hypothetical protein GS429_16505 [Natronorubrum sp. JWXQ-INN-674]|uniref:Uncharacterized protein n=1 Tax=Natronorubrum halalkaliphilum TaxID=2691917 RepID=A0A6B0VP84_9EURY|nr:DUF5802 family protein [Natronorubrum halalkaliphilum]MXV63631.1 hypothetical protein [Natronorubrum halalkaliphilum]
MFEVFSQSYYLGRLYVTPTDGDHALMHSDQHERINEEVYATGDGVERLDTPLVMKLESRHFPVHGNENVPTNTLALPESMLEGTDVRNPPSLREVWLARRERAKQLLRFTCPGDWSDWSDSDDELRNAGT